MNDLVDEIERRKLEAEEKRKQEEEEAAQKKFIGTRVTVESFLQWKEKFDAELEALKSQKQKELEAAMKAKLSIDLSSWLVYSKSTFYIFSSRALYLKFIIWLLRNAKTDNFWKGRLTGKQQFLQKKAGDEISSEVLVANQVQVDESLFDDEDLEDLDELDIPDE